MGLFNPDQLAMMEVEQAMDTTFVVLPIGDYTFVVDDLEVREIEPQDSSKDPFHVLELKCSVDGSAMTPDGSTVQAVTGREKATARYKGFLDIKNGAFELGKGKNIDLGKIREATGLNVPGQKFGLNMLKGRSFVGSVVHVPDRRDPTKVFPEIKNPRQV